MMRIDSPIKVTLSYMNIGKEMSNHDNKRGLGTLSLSNRKQKGIEEKTMTEK
jgi:hypothetical protein